MLNKRVIVLSIPLFGLVALFFYLFRSPAYQNHTIIVLFSILAASYLSGILFFSYDRLLEIKHDYAGLFISFIPYALLLIVTPILSYSTIPHTVLIIQAIRLMSALMRVAWGYRVYQAAFPVMFLCRIAAITLLFCASATFIILYSSMALPSIMRYNLAMLI